MNSLQDSLSPVQDGVGSCFPNLRQVPGQERRPGDGCEDDATSQSSAHFVSVQSQISKVRMLRDIVSKKVAVVCII